MRIAPLIATWRERYPVFGRGAGSSADIGGVPFSPEEFGPAARLIVEAAFGADINADPTTWTWYDISGDVRYADGGRVNIAPIGRSDETSTAQPAGCAFELDNETGDYTAYNPSSKWWPYVRRNTPIRVMVNFTGYPNDSLIRFQGYATGWVPGWDISANVATVAVQAQGITRRLVQGATPLKAALTRALTAAAPSAYWPLDDADSATQAASGLAGGAAMTITDGIDFAAYTDLYGLDRAIDPGTGSMHGDIPGTHAAALADVSFVFGFAMKAPVIPSSDPVATHPVLTVNTNGFFSQFKVSLFFTELDSIALTATTPVGDKSFIFDAPTDFENEWHYYEFLVEYTTSTDRMAVRCALDGGALSLSASYTGLGITAMSDATSVDVNSTQADFGALGLAGIYVKNGVSTTAGVGASYNGYTGETPVERLIRLCNEENIRLNLTGTSSTTMGPQPTDTFMTLVRECESADQGVLYDGRGPGLSYVTRAARYNLTATLELDADAEQVGYPFGPVDDDQRNRNLAKATRKNGSSAIHEQASGELGTAAIGIYDTSLTVNVETDEQVAPYAEWITHLGTIPGFRYPKLNLNLRATPAVAPEWLQCGVSSRIDVVNLATVATQHPDADVRLILEGWEETLSPLDWTVRANTSQYDGWAVGAIDTAGYLDCGASYLSSGLDTATTSVPLLITDTCTWTHADGDYDIVIGAEVMTVTAVSAASGAGSAWTQTLTVTRGVNGITAVHATFDEVHVNDPFTLAL